MDSVGSRQPESDSEESGDSRFASEEQTCPPPQLINSKDSKAQYLCDEEAQAVKNLQLVTSCLRAIQPSDKDERDGDPLYIGFPNHGNSCYKKNAAFQSLLGLRPFLSEMVSRWFLSEMVFQE